MSAELPGRPDGACRCFFLVRTLLVFIVLDIGFRLFGYPRMYGFVHRWSRRSAGAAPPANPSGVVERTLEGARRATRCYWRSGRDCLPRSLAVYLLLRRGGIPATFHIGVRRYPFGAHAWVEWEGRRLDDAPARQRRESYMPIISTGAGALPTPVRRTGP